MQTHQIYVSHVAPKSIKIDRTRAYEPPTEVTSCKARLKVGQVRRLASLLRHSQKISRQRNKTQLLQQLQLEWEAIKRAQGFGRSWAAWLLGFDFVHCVPDNTDNTPSTEWLQDAYSITKFNPMHMPDRKLIYDATIRSTRLPSPWHTRITHKHTAYRFIKGKEQSYCMTYL